MKVVVLDGQTLNPGDNPWTPIQNSLGPSDKFEVYAKSNLQQTLERAANAQIVLTNKTQLNQQTLEALTDLKLVCVLATGVNTVDVEAAKRLGIRVCNVPEYGTDSVAQFVISQLLYFAHRVALHDAQIRNGKWGELGEFCFWDTPQIELAGLTFGIIGYGRIGQAVARLASAFGMSVIAYSPSGPKPDGIVTPVSLTELYNLSDIISLHCVLTRETQDLINAQSLSQMKKSAYLINTARGSLINEADLANALQAGVIAGAALDVVPQEPIQSESPLFRAPNLLLTPHMAWGSIQARKRLMQTTADNITGFISGDLQNTVA